MSRPSTYADVLLPHRTDRPYTYRVDEGMDVREGQFVEVPLRNKAMAGVVWAVSDTSSCAPNKLKSIGRVFDAAPMPKVSRDFIQWVATYTMAPVGNVLKMAMSIPQALEEFKTKPAFAKGNILDFEALSAARKKIAGYLETVAHPVVQSEVVLRSGGSAATLKAMVKAGQVVQVDEVPVAGTIDYTHVELSDEQEQAAAQVIESLGTPEVFLMDGVTGSGKTEVYFEAIFQAIERGQQALIMLPEISLSTQSLQRFCDRFGVEPVVWHSDMPQAKRRKAWRDVLEGRADVVIGARSALFLPFSNLGLIIVDEEHDGSYKQEEGVIYNARDMAVVRGRLGNCPVVLVSATPCLETLENAKSGKYQWLKLLSRHGKAQLPSIHVVDMRLNKKTAKPLSKWISPTLIAAIHKAVENKQQALVFMNRRGYAPLTLCQSCGERFECRDCSVWMVEHKHLNCLMCHHCGYQIPLPKECPKCKDSDNIVSSGPGVERIAEDLQKLFPTYRTEIMASDIMTSHTKMQALIQDIHQGKVDIIVGTQMIAKGHHFPNLTVVGVVDADLGLAGGDLRSGERTYQLLNQVSGRAGREENPGHVYLQTFTPEHPVLKALLEGQRDDFIQTEKDGRQLNELPPYGRLASVIVSCRDQTLGEAYVRAMAKNQPVDPQVHVYGPAPAALFRLRSWYRWRFLIKTPKSVKSQRYIQIWLARMKQPAAIKIQVDIDPYTFL